MIGRVNSSFSPLSFNGPLTAKDMALVLALASSVFLTVHQCTHHLVSSARAEAAVCGTVNTRVPYCREKAARAVPLAGLNEVGAL